MALKIIGAGFGRTGTMSLYTALNQLGYPCYHMHEVRRNVTNKNHIDFWLKVANSKPGVQHDWDEIFKDYTATVDNPGAPVWRELVAANPDAKVILTLHPGGPESWHQSTLDTIYFTKTLWAFKVLKLVSPRARKSGKMVNRLIWERFHQGTMVSREKSIARYQSHMEEVKAAIPADRLLIYSVDQGWQPLCDFLGVPVPETPFPNVNDRLTFQKTIQDITRAGYIISGVALAIMAGLIYGSFRYFS